MDHQYRLWLIESNTIELNLTDSDRQKLRRYLDGFTYRNFGIETQPETFVFAAPCKWAKPKNKNDRTLPGGIVVRARGINRTIVIDRVYKAAFVLEFERYPKEGYCVSHICGSTGSRCIEHTHFEVVPVGNNIGRNPCHKDITSWEFSERLNGMEPEQRQGTIFEHSCEHWPQCFKQLGEF